MVNLLTLFPKQRQTCDPRLGSLGEFGFQGSRRNQTAIPDRVVSRTAVARIPTYSNKCQIFLLESLPNAMDCLAVGVVPWHTFNLAGRLQNCGLRAPMTHRTLASELSEKLGYPTSDTIQGLRLLKAFIKLSPSQRSEVIELVEQLANDPAPFSGGANGRFRTR
jgi:hypothetical protein